MSIILRLKNKTGETIAETLVATLISALAMVMFAGMVMASKNIIEDSNKKMLEYYNGFSSINSRLNAGSTIDSFSIGNGVTLYTDKNGIMYLGYRE